MEALLDPPVVAVVVRGGELDVPLSPVESSAIEGAVPARRREFTTGRALAREALSLLGCGPDVPVGTGWSGAPVWPSGVVGSITHCSGLRACAVAPSSVAAIGIDAEPCEPLPPGVLSAIASPAERDSLPDGDEIPWDRLLFCAKEAAFKAWFPLTGERLGFEDAHVSLDPAGTFTVDLAHATARRAGLPEGWSLLHAVHFRDGVTGRWAVDDGHLVAAVVVPR